MLHEFVYVKKPVAVYPANEEGKPDQLVLGRITELSELVTLRVPVSELCVTEISGYTGSIRCLLLAHGDVELGVDLNRAQFENVNPSNKTATLVLPHPRTRRARLDHNRTSVYRIDRFGLWRIRFTDEKARRVVNKAMKDALAAVALVGRGEKLKVQARRQAEAVIRGAMEVGGGMLGLIGWVTEAVSLSSGPVSTHVLQNTADILAEWPGHQIY